MKAWPFWYLAIVWLAAAVLLIALVLLDVRRAREIAVALPRPATWQDWLGAGRALTREVPIAVGALLGIPALSAAITLWWAVSRV